jgi:hypothetical protein
MPAGHGGKDVTVLKHLSIDEMGSLVRPWVSQAKRKAAFLSIPEIAGLHAKVVQIYPELLAARPAASTVSPALQAIIDEAAAVDVTHDALARAVHSGVVADRALALADKPPAPERAKQADEALAKLFPQGLAIVNASLLAESGNTARVAALLEQDPDVAAFLEAIPVQKAGTLLVVTQRWIAAGKKLAKLEDDREELEAEQVTAPLTREAVNRLRARWIRLVAQVLSLLELSDADAKAIALIRRPVQKASARAGKRYGEPGENTNAEEPEGELADDEEPDDGDDEPETTGGNGLAS